MNITSYVFGIASAVAALIVVIEMLRHRRLRERHAVWWLVAGVAALVAGIFPQTLTWTASLIGVEVPTNLVFFVGITVLFFVCLQSSAELTRLEDKTRKLAERSAILEIRLRQLEHRLGVSEPRDDDTAPFGDR